MDPISTQTPRSKWGPGEEVLKWKYRDNYLQRFMRYNRTPSRLPEIRTPVLGQRLGVEYRICVDYAPVDSSP